MKWGLHTFVVVDRLTGYTWGVPVRKEGLTAEKLAEIFLESVGWMAGCPTEIFSDHDNLMASNFVGSMCAHPYFHTSILIVVR